MTQTLGSAITISKGKKHEINESPSSDAKRLIGIDDLRNDDLLRYTDDRKGVEAVPEDVLIAWDGANAGTIGYGKSGFIGSTIARLRIKPESKLFTPFLGIFLKSQFDFLRKTATGATIPHINRKALEGIPLPKIERDDQIRIAHLLGKVEGLIARRKQHLQQLDDLLKSVFVEMFGDPVRNEKGWGKKPFSDLLSDIESGKSPKCEARPAAEEEWGVLKLGAVTRCVFDGNENKALPVEHSPTVKHEVKAGDLLFSRKNTYELVAACAYVYETRPRLLMPDLIFRFVFKEDAGINPIYIWKLLTNNSQRKAIQAFAAGAAGSMPNISKANLKTAQLPVPPIDIQNQFAIIVEKVESLKSLYQQNLNDLEFLYGALSQQAFKGELDLSQVPLIESNQPEDNDPQEIQPGSDITETKHKNTILLASQNGRLKLVRQELEKAINALYPDEAFDVNFFWIELLGNSIEFVDENSDVFGLPDYESLKNWIFEKLDSGELGLRYDEIMNVELYKLAK
ncbi:restriction endonuclease subunit S [Oceanobacter kriegii]|uniref:restriction endonuclease subunit S n=1 Tax=Oceanobacter kriegii TaxID=64972 RepID=UPI00040E5B30|nr:restriction endonuclease subunit S [Oceanobacter kriegii]